MKNERGPGTSVYWELVCVEGRCATAIIADAGGETDLELVTSGLCLGRRVEEIDGQNLRLSVVFLIKICRWNRHLGIGANVWVVNVPF